MPPNHLTLITHRTVLHDKAVRRTHRAEELKLILSLYHQRKLTKNLTIQFRNTEYQLTSYGKGYRLRGATITICQNFNGSVTEATQSNANVPDTATRRASRYNCR